MQDDVIRARIASYDDVVAAIRSRIDDIHAPQRSIEEYSGLSDGYISKIINPAQTKPMGIDALMRLLKAIGYRMAFVEHLDTAATRDEMGNHFRHRDDTNRRTGLIRKHISPDLQRLVMRQMGAKGGSMQKRYRIPPERLSEIRRAAANVRWARQLQPRNARARRKSENR